MSAALADRGRVLRFDAEHPRRLALSAKRRGRSTSAHRARPRGIKAGAFRELKAEKRRSPLDVPDRADEDCWSGDNFHVSQSFRAWTLSALVRFSGARQVLKGVVPVGVRSVDQRHTEDPLFAKGPTPPRTSGAGGRARLKSRLKGAEPPSAVRNGHRIGSRCSS